MANEEHLRILQSGVEKWNEWRQIAFSEAPNLSEADLHGVDLSQADLRRANFCGADLRGAILDRADLSDADLRGADLSEGLMLGTNLFKANLRGANLTETMMFDCLFSNVSLVGIDGLQNVNHIGPSEISVSTLEMTAADLTEDLADQHAIELFLGGAGVPKKYIDFFCLRIGKAIQFHSCFISHSTKDQEFADRLYTDLRQKSIRCWLATEDLKIGDKFRTRINQAIRIHDKLMVILSEHSVKSSWVEEGEAAFDKETQDRTVLFPIRLDDVIMDCKEAWAESIRRTRHIGDFRKWKDHDEYQKSLARLIRDLQAHDKTKPVST